MRISTRRTAMATAVVAAALVMSACGSSGGGGSSSSPATTGSASTAGFDAAAAETITKPYTGQPSAFPITTDLVKNPKGKRIAYLDCGTPICGLFSQLAAPAFKELGMEFTTIKAGFQPDVVQQAFDAVIAGKYDGIFVPAIPPQLWQRGLEQAKAAGIPIVTSGVVGADPTWVKVQQAGENSASIAGKVMAAWALEQKQAETDAVLYTTPELPFQAVISKSFTETYKQLCPGCKLRETKVSAATFGTKSAQVIIDDLQANPTTNVAVLGIGEQGAGLPAALKTAGITLPFMVNSPDPAILEGIKKGDFTAGLGLDLPVISWTVADSLARQTMGDEPAPGAVEDIPPQQILVAADLQYDVSKGWTGYPDFAARFTKLWAPALKS